jgi:nitrilase
MDRDESSSGAGRIGPLRHSSDPPPRRAMLPCCLVRRSTSPGLSRGVAGRLSKGPDLWSHRGSSHAGRARPVPPVYESVHTCPGVETEQLAGWAQELQLHIVIGVVEQSGATLYCSGLVFSPEGRLVGKHRKLIPTGTERLLWGQGTGSTLQVADTELGRIGVAICWENYMPLYRQHLYEQGVQLWCAPTVDAREMWVTSMRHIAYEGRCFVLSACQYLTREDWPDDLREMGGTIEGRSVVISPLGEVIAGPLAGEGLLFADIDLEDIQRGKFDLDVAGHYNRPDLFRFHVLE